MNGAGVPEGGPAPAFWTGLLTWLAEHDALLLFLSVLVEEGGVPLPVPSDVAVLVAAHRAARGEMSLLSVFVIVQAATLIGASVLYWAGRRAGRPLLYRYGGILHLDQARLAKVERMVTQHGALAVIVGRLVPGLRIVTPLACGVFRVPYRQFLPALAVASSVYLAVVIAVGVVGGPALLGALDSGILPVRFLVTTLLLGGAVFFLERLSRRVRARLTPGHRLAAGGRPSFEAALLAGLGASAVTGLAVSWLLALLALLGLPAAERALLEALQRGGQTFPLHAIFPSPLLPPGLSIPAWPEGLGALLPLLVMAQLLWAVLYAAVAEPRLRGSAGVRGLQFALVPWLTSGLLYLPLIGAGPFGLALGAGWLPILGEAVRCAIFGISLGVLYRLVRLARQPRKHSGWRRGFRRRGERPPVPATARATGAYP
jgi:membrane protein DedA with SNARE-associated domain